MPLATLEQLTEDRLETREVPCPELGEDMRVLVRMLPGTELHQLQRAAEKNNADGMAEVCRMCVCNESGQRLFSSTDQVMQMPAPVLVRIAIAASELNTAGETGKQTESSSGGD